MSCTLKDSKSFKTLFAEIIKQYTSAHATPKSETSNPETETSDTPDQIENQKSKIENPETDDFLTCEVDHVDGTMNALIRDHALRWLKAPTDPNTCRILSNARCLSEGVDVPALDAVMFLNPRNSVVDVVQSVGRVMRKAPGKKYGYIILPIGIPAEMAPEDALADNDKYKVVWQVLQALRAHDNRFDAIINKLDLNKERPDQIQIIGVGGGEPPEPGQAPALPTPVQLSLSFPQLENWKDAIFAKIALKCGTTKYWETWAHDVAQIATRHITRIKGLLESSNGKYRKPFEEFLSGLQATLNPSIGEAEAVEMLAQHLVTKPVFDALFERYEFTKQNPVSVAMSNMIAILEGQNLQKEAASLDAFYDSVRQRAGKIDNLAARQKIIIELYDKFFKMAFPRIAERLGIVYTPIEIVDFILHSANDALKSEFGVSLSDINVHILDPFTGTATFIVRLLQSDLINDEDLARKYKEELHANEIVLLAYYIAAINIEEAYHDRSAKLTPYPRRDREGASQPPDASSPPSLPYQPFEGIVLTDTFQMFENAGDFHDTWSPENNQRAARQKTREIRVIVANPPYSAQQESENDNNRNLKYPALDNRIRTTYAAHSSAVTQKNLYDSYIRSIRWASDRLGDRGINCYVTNGSFIDGNNMDGLRKCLMDEFTAVYCFNLRGNARTSGEQRRAEKGNVFGGGTRTPVAITLLVKNPQKPRKCRLFYNDIGDYLTREEKLKIIADFRTTEAMPWQDIAPNKNHDWINQRDPAFANFIPLGDKSDNAGPSIFPLYSLGVITKRDAWAYNFSKHNLSANMRRMIAFYNDQVVAYKAARAAHPETVKLEDFIDTDPRKISWAPNLRAELAKFARHDFEPECMARSMYRPFCKQWLYFNRRFIERICLMPRIFPSDSAANFVISVTGVGATKEFSALITDSIPNLHLHDTGQCFPLHSYNESEDPAQTTQDGMFDSETPGASVSRDNVADGVLADFCRNYDPKISKEDIFYYVYGILHSPEYKRRFASDLKKMLPRIPFAADFWAFSKAGRKLADIHLNYETAQPYPVQQQSDMLELDPKSLYRVEKMAFGKINKKPDKTTILYNNHIALSGIPLETYDYVVNGRPALEWIIERYQITKDPDSQIVNDPNDWAAEHHDPQYILNLLKSIITVSLETMKIVKSLPPLNERP